MFHPFIVFILFSQWDSSLFPSLSPSPSFSPLLSPSLFPSVSFSLPLFSPSFTLLFHCLLVLPLSASACSSPLSPISKFLFKFHFRNALLFTINKSKTDRATDLFYPIQSCRSLVCGYLYAYPARLTWLILRSGQTRSPSLPNDMLLWCQNDFHRLYETV